MRDVPGILAFAVREAMHAAWGFSQVSRLRARERGRNAELFVEPLRSRVNPGFTGKVNPPSADPPTPSRSRQEPAARAGLVDRVRRYPGFLRRRRAPSRRRQSARAGAQSPARSPTTSQWRASRFARAPVEPFVGGLYVERRVGPVLVEVISAEAAACEPAQQLQTVSRTQMVAYITHGDARCGKVLSGGGGVQPSSAFINNITQNSPAAIPGRTLAHTQSPRSPHAIPTRCPRRRCASSGKSREALT